MTTLLESPTKPLSAPQKWAVETPARAGDSGDGVSVASENSTCRRSPPLSPRPPANPESTKPLGYLVSMARGEHGALASCYDAMGTIVFSLAVRMLRDRPAAEDVTQDIFTQVWRQAGRFDPARGGPEAWIMMIARTRILDRIRSRSAGIKLKSVGDNLPDSPDAEDWPEDAAITREDAVNVRQSLSTLPADQKQAVEMAFFDGLTHQEISEKLKVPLGTIKTRIRLGLLKIRDAMQERIGYRDEASFEERV